MNLDQFNKDSLYSKTFVYWCEEWNECSDSVKNGSIGIDIVNIRVILLDLINEYDLNKFESENNRKVYLRLIEKFINDRHIKLYKDELLILKEKLEKKDSQAVYIIAKEISKRFSEVNFAQSLFDELLVIINKKLFSKKDRVKIKNLTKDIIIELVTSGRDIKDINNLLSDVLKTYEIVNEKPIILFDFTPSDLSPEQAKEYIDNLSLSDRLDFFRESLISTKFDYLFIFPIFGMIAPSKDEQESIFSLNIYDPLREKQFPDDTWFDETFSRSKKKEFNDEYNSRCNAVVRVHASSNNVAKKIAEDKFSMFLSLANLKYGHKHHEFYWDGQYIGKRIDVENGSFGTPFSIDRDDRVFRRSISRDKPVYLSSEKYNSMKNYTKVVDVLQKRNMFIEKNTIINVVELMSKSIWETEENKLLNYWICLESLSNISKKNTESTFTFIKETVSNIYFLGERYGPIQNLFLLTEYYTIHTLKDDESIHIPNEFLEDVDIYKIRIEDSVVSLVKFQNRMKELLSFTTKESFLDSIEDTLDFYQDNQKALQILRNKKDEVKMTIDYIYKSRNQIVHNGYVAKNLIPYLVNFAEGYAKSLFHRIIDVYLEGEYDLQNYFIKELYEGVLLEKKLASKDFYALGLEEYS